MDHKGLEPLSYSTFLWLSTTNRLWGVMESNHSDRSVEPASLTAKWTPQIRILHFTIMLLAKNTTCTNFSYLFKVRVSFFSYSIDYRNHSSLISLCDPQLLKSHSWTRTNNLCSLNKCVYLCYLLLNFFNLLRAWRDSNPHHTAWQAGIVNHSTTRP